MTNAYRKPKFFPAATLIMIAVIAFLLLHSFSRKHLSGKAPVDFVRHTITSEFLAEGVAVADVNKDGNLDIISGSFWFAGPDWKPHEIDLPEKFNPSTGYSHTFMCYSMDVNKDGWTDMIRIGRPGDAAYWFENPQNKLSHWEKHSLYPSVGNEAAGLYDMNGNGIPDLLFADSRNKRVMWLERFEQSWKENIISDHPELGTHQYTHGLGFGDIDGDGINDVFIKDGWWKGPSKKATGAWKFTAAPLGDDCAQMFTLDIDMDGDNDVISSSAHDYGIWWHEQIRDNGKGVKWKTHLISRLFSQSHGLVLQDVDGDQNPDLVTGKRYYAHNGKDPGAEDAPVLYWFQFFPGKNPRWVPHLIDSTSGAGLNFVVEDLNKDGLMDIVISNKKGLKYFKQIRNKR